MADDTNTGLDFVYRIWIDFCFAFHFSKTVSLLLCLFLTLIWVHLHASASYRCQFSPRWSRQLSSYWDQHPNGLQCPLGSETLSASCHSLPPTLPMDQKYFGIDNHLHIWNEYVIFKTSSSVQYSTLCKLFYYNW